MSLAGLPEWVSELISKGESVSACLSLYKEMQVTEREERAAEREMRKTEIGLQYLISNYGITSGFNTLLTISGFQLRNNFRLLYLNYVPDSLLVTTLSL
jgi:hypothetical protein